MGRIKGLMRWFIWLLVLAFLGTCVYGYIHNQTGCAKLETDVRTDYPTIAADVTAIFATTTTPDAADTPTAADGTPAAPAVSPVPVPLPLPLPVNTLIQNGDFSQGAAHWDGDGKTPAQYAAKNPAARGNPLMSKGFIVTLNPTSWTRIYQTFATGQETRYSIVVNYRLSPDISLSKNPADYTGINKLIQISGFENYGSFNSSPGQFYGTIGDPTSSTVVLEVYAPTLGTSDIQTYQHSYPVSPVTQTKIFALAFPPGSGTVVILGAAVTGN